MRWRAFSVPPPDAAVWWQGRAATFSPGSASLRRDRDEVAVEPRDADAAFARGRDALLDYRIYPESILLHRIGTPGGRIAKGAVIVQRIRVGPLAVEAGVRVVEAWDQPGRVGYRYVTLRGHPERGVASFHLERAGGRVAFRIESESECAVPGLAGYARRRQREAVAGALAGMTRSLAE
ncbi:MAG TPA: DUF1990 family protein [Candidatus Thermoplasmatota archaeon]|nr:DUF1990 family protein [Candidatus Thermoplasmatota archaeon]